MNVSSVESKILEVRRNEIPKVKKTEKKDEINIDNQKSQKNNLKSNDGNINQEETLLNKIKEVLEELDANTVDVNVGFKLRDDFEKPVIEVIDKETQKVIRQIPSEEFIRRMNNMEELKGMLFDGKF